MVYVINVLMTGSLVTAVVLVLPVY